MIEIIIVLWGDDYWDTFKKISFPSIANSIRYYMQGCLNSQEEDLKIQISIWGLKKEKHNFINLKNSYHELNLKFNSILVNQNNVTGQTKTLQKIILKNNKRYRKNRIRSFYFAKLKYWIKQIRVLNKKNKNYSFLKFYKEEKQRYNQDSRGIVYVPADMIWSENFISTIIREYKRGSVCLYAIYLRACEEAIRKKNKTGKFQNLNFYKPRNLVRLALKHPHPLTCAHFKDSKFFPDHYEYFYEKKGRNIEARCLSTTVTMFRFGTVLLDSFFKTKNLGLWKNVTVITDSDRMFAISLTPILKDWEWLLSFPQKNLLVLNSWKKIFSNRLFNSIEKMPILFRC